jgi:hypothetical protein
VKRELAGEYIKLFSKRDNEQGDSNMHGISVCPERALPDAWQTSSVKIDAVLLPELK